MSPVPRVAHPMIDAPPVEPRRVDAYLDSLTDQRGRQTVSAIRRFLGDSPLRVAIKLLVVSFLVGLVMSTFHWTPWDVCYAVRDFARQIWDMGFEAVRRFGDYIVLGAAIVVPLFFVMRVLSFRGSQWIVSSPRPV